MAELVSGWVEPDSRALSLNHCTCPLRKSPNINLSLLSLLPSCTIKNEEWSGDRKVLLEVFFLILPSLKIVPILCRGSPYWPTRWPYVSWSAIFKSGLQMATNQLSGSHSGVMLSNRTFCDDTSVSRVSLCSPMWHLEPHVATWVPERRLVTQQRWIFNVM